MGRHKSKRSRRHSSDTSSEEEQRKECYQKGREDVSTNLATFSFLDHKTELNRMLLGYSPREELVENARDFWLFVNKYESLLKNSGNCILLEVKEELDKLPKGFPSEFNKLHLNNVRFAVPMDELLNRVGSANKLSRSKRVQFLQIVLQYLDFRQKEKFGKLKKLRESQATLPVAKFKDEIIKAVQNEQVLLLAGDTGCGKSTQIPQYLCEAGYKNIGK